MLTYRPRRWLVHLALAFGAGVFLGWHSEGQLIWLLGLALCLLLGWLLRGMGRSIYLPCMAAAVLLGLVRCVAAQPSLPPEGICAVTARVTGEAAVREKDGRVAVYLKDAELAGVPGRYRVYWTYWPETPDEPLPMRVHPAGMR